VTAAERRKVGTPDEARALEIILKIEGLNLHILKLALYYYRKQNGICIHATCKETAVPGRVRCKKHLRQSRRAPQMELEF
jgi:hypothetical protein